MGLPCRMGEMFGDLKRLMTEGNKESPRVGTILTPHHVLAAMMGVFSVPSAASRITPCRGFRASIPIHADLAACVLPYRPEITMRNRFSQSQNTASPAFQPITRT